MIKLSVVIPVYNAEKYLPGCMESVLSQSFSDFEIILINDGSADSSAGLCDRYAEKYPFVRAVHQQNVGASAARNRGLREAKGEFVHFVDSDDHLANSEVYYNLSQHALDPSHDIIFFRRERFTEGVEGIDAVQPAYDIDGEFSGDVLGLVLQKKYEMTLTCPVNKIFRRELLIENDLYFTEGIDHEEDEWLPRVVSCAKRVWFDKGIYYTVRQRPDSLSQTVSETRTTDRACSKIKIASSGMEYMEQKSLAPETLALAADYYWNYMIDACVDINTLRQKENKERVYRAIKDNKHFFKSSRLLKSKNRRMLGQMFRVSGIRPTVKMIGIRYGK